MEKQKMQMKKYISIAISSLIFGILAWVLVDPNITSGKSSKYICLIGGGSSPNCICFIHN